LRNDSPQRMSAVFTDLAVVPYVRVPHSAAGRRLDPRSKAYYECLDTLGLLLLDKRNRLGYSTLTCPVKLTFTVWSRKRFAGDLDNLLKTIMDALKRGKWIKDDRQVKWLGDCSVLEEATRDGVAVVLPLREVG